RRRRRAAREGRRGGVHDHGPRRHRQHRRLGTGVPLRTRRSRPDPTGQPMKPACVVGLLLALAAPLGADVRPGGFHPPYPPSPVIAGLTFNDRSARTEAPGSDIFPITWAEDNELYTAWG